MEPVVDSSDGVNVTDNITDNISTCADTVANSTTATVTTTKLPRVDALIWVDSVIEHNAIITRNQADFKTVLSQFYKPHLSRMILGIKDAAYQRIDKDKFRDFKINFSSIHCIDNSSHTITELMCLIQELEFDTAATVKWRYKAAYDNTRTHSDKMLHLKDGNFINCVTDGGFNLSNVRSLVNRLEPVDLVICDWGGVGGNVSGGVNSSGVGETGVNGNAGVNGSGVVSSSVSASNYKATNYAIVFAMKMSKSAFMVKLETESTFTKCLITIARYYGHVEIIGGYLCVHDYKPIGKILYNKLLDCCDKPDVKIVQL